MIPRHVFLSSLLLAFLAAAASADMVVQSNALATHIIFPIAQGGKNS